jgi:putative ABC transport system permease protein
VRALGAAFPRVFGTVGRLSRENALRNPRRTAATASALMIGLALVTTMAIVGDSAKKSVDRAVDENFLGDLVVSNVFGVPFSPSVGDRVERTPGVASVTRVRYGIARLGTDRAGIMAVDPASLRDGTVLVDQKTAEDKDISVGDRVRWSMPTGAETYRVVGIYQDNPVLAFPFTTTLRTLADAGFQTSDNYLLVTEEPGADAARVRSRIERQTAALPTVTVKDQAGYAAEQRGPIDQLLTLIYALLGLALVIAVLGIVNTLALSVIERTREVGLLRAIGLSRAQLRTMIRLEAVVIAVLGSGLGVAMGVVFGTALMAALRDQGLEVVSVPVAQLIGFIVASAVLGIMAAVVPARRAARLDVLAAIATE